MVKWIANPYVRLLLNGIHTDFDTPVTTNGTAYDTEKAVAARVQLDF
jgi:phosphate-selective porin OprO/OprP